MIRIHKSTHGLKEDKYFEGKNNSTKRVIS